MRDSRFFVSVACRWSENVVEIRRTILAGVVERGGGQPRAVPSFPFRPSAHRRHLARYRSLDHRNGSGWSEWAMKIVHEDICLVAESSDDILDPCGSGAVFSLVLTGSAGLG